MNYEKREISKICRTNTNTEDGRIDELSSQYLAKYFHSKQITDWQCAHRILVKRLISQGQSRWRESGHGGGHGPERWSKTKLRGTRRRISRRGKRFRRKASLYPRLDRSSRYLPKERDEWSGQGREWTDPIIPLPYNGISPCPDDLRVLDSNLNNAKKKRKEKKKKKTREGERSVNACRNSWRAKSLSPCLDHYAVDLLSRY